MIISGFYCRLESNTCTCFIENSWKFWIWCPNYFLFVWPNRPWLIGFTCFGSFLFWLWLVSISGEGSLPKMTLSDTSKINIDVLFIYITEVFICYILKCNQQSISVTTKMDITLVEAKTNLYLSTIVHHCILKCLIAERVRHFCARVSISFYCILTSFK